MGSGRGGVNVGDIWTNQYDADGRRMNSYGPNTPWGYLSRMQFGADALRPPNPNELGNPSDIYARTSGGLSTGSERMMMQGGLAGVDPTVLRELFANQEPMQVEIVNHFYDNPVPAKTAVDEFEYEVNHLRGRE